MLFRITLLGALCAAAVFSQASGEAQDLKNAVSLHQAGDYTGAIAGYQRFLKAHPEAASVRSNLGAALAHEGRLEEAIAEYKLALDADPRNPNVRLNLAVAYFK